MPSPDELNRPNMFLGDLNLDDDLHLIEATDFVDNLNIRNTLGALPGAIINRQGNVEVSNPLLPAGVNTVIGACEDKRTNTVFYFVHNSNDDHCIFRYYPEKTTVDPNGEIELIIKSPTLNFNLYWKAHSSRYVDDKFLYWIDQYSDKGIIEGNPPRKINAEKANITGKFLEYEVVAGLPGQGQFATSLADGNTVVIRARMRSTGGIIGQVVITALQLNNFIDDPYGFLDYLAVRINTNLAPSSDTTAEYCEECRTTIRLNQDDTYLEIFETDPPLPNHNFWFIRTNHYPDNIVEQHLDVIMWPPKYEITSRYIVESTFPANNVNKSIFQFRTRFWYADGEKSAWGPISILALPIDRGGVFLESLNAIEINFTDELLNNPDTLNIIRKVEIAFREGNLGLFRTADILDICEIGINQQIYIFRNDKMYSIVPSDDTPVSGQTQALKLFDSVPRIAGTMETVADRKGNNRLYYGANLENYNVLECIDLAWELGVTPDDEGYITITGRVDISYLTGMANDNFFRPAVTSLDPTYDLDQTVLEGFVVYLAGTTYYGISKNFMVPTVVTATGEFEIRNVPKGRYIMRVANWRCRLDDSKGEIYNISNGIAFQRTSAPVMDCAGSLSATGIPYERELDLTTSGPIFDLLTEPGFGPIIIQNWQLGPTYIGPGPSDYVYYEGSELYFLDNEAEVTDNAVRRGAIGVERQLVHFSATRFSGLVFYTFPADLTNPTYIDTVNGNLETDHNGYAWAIFLSDELFTSPPYQLGAYQNLFVEVRDACAGTTKNLNQGEIVLYAGGMEALWQNTDVDNLGAGLDPTGIYVFGMPQTNIYNIDTDFTTKNKTLIQGSIVEQTNTPVPNVLVFYTRNGRQQFTDTLGGYSIAIYCPWDANGRNDDTLYVTYPTDNNYDYPPNLPSQIPSVLDFCGNPYDSTHPFTVILVIFPFQGAIVQVDRYLKRGGVYRTGIVYEDRANRKATVAEGPTLRIPYFTEPGAGFTRASAFWSIDSVPPEWATHYRIVLSRDSYYRRYLQWVAESVEYAIIASVGASPVATSFANGDATHVMIQISAIITDIDPLANPVEWFFFGTNLQGFSAQPGDRVRLVLDELGALVTTTQIYDFEIVGVYRNGTDYFVVIETPEIFREIKANWLVELYTPKKSEEVVFFEMGDTHEIIDAGLPTRRHAGSTQNQIIGIQPATGFLVGGDTYWRNKNFTVADTVVFNYQVENMNITDRFDSEFSDIGRPNVRDDDFGERFYFNRIRFSGIYIPDSKINGLSAFRAIDVQSLDMRYGILMKLIIADNVMLAICQFKTQPIYVAKDKILDLSGAGSVGRSDTILNLADELKFDLGTQNPESVVEQDGHVYGIDLYQGAVWRYSQNGQFPISKYKAQRFFNKIGKTLTPIDRKLTRVYGFYEREYDMFGLTFAPNALYADGMTIEFAEDKNRWNNFASFIAEAYAPVGDRLVSFKDGKLYLHEGDGQVPCNFFGVQHEAKVKIVSNLAPRAVKNWENITIQADNQWICPSIVMPKSYSFPFGMESELDTLHFHNEEGIWKAEFLRDKTDPDPRFNSIVNPVEREIAKLLRGRLLRGEIVIIELKLVNSSIDSVLRRVDIENRLSMDTKA